MALGQTQEALYRGFASVPQAPFSDLKVCVSIQEIL